MILQIFRFFFILEKSVIGDRNFVEFVQNIRLRLFECLVKLVADFGLIVCGRLKLRLTIRMQQFIIALFIFLIGDIIFFAPENHDSTPSLSP